MAELASANTLILLAEHDGAAQFASAELDQARTKCRVPTSSPSSTPVGRSASPRRRTWMPRPP
ncbi:MAG TPA: hypothetical protein VHX52_11600 [Steroidobacteraceae bacterium]|nr:hypothetical protein [Steroidobacteraceae bacterium]